MKTAEGQLLLVLCFLPALGLWSLCVDLAHTFRFASSCAQDSLLRLKDHKQCFECSDVALNEAVQQMVNSTESAAKEEWVATVTQLLLGIEQALSSDSSGSILKESSSTTGLVRLTTNLIQVTLASLHTVLSSAGVSLQYSLLRFTDSHCDLCTPKRHVDFFG